MKLNTALTRDHSSAGFGETRQFGFEMNAFAFHAVIDGIYSDKIGAPVREYMTNAWDAHRMVGKDDVPFVVMAPSTFHPYFMVRDFGPGMTHEEVTERATTMFASDKRDTNVQAGMLGLGMKSGFAYTSQYTITCYTGSEKREYVCFLDESGAPSVTAMDPVADSEPRGVKVTFPVKQHDIHRFCTAVEKVMIGFDPMPKVLNDQWKPAEPTTIMKGSNFRIVNSHLIKRPYVQQGCVLYPLNLGEFLDNYDYGFTSLPIIIDVPIGTASVSTSRESLGYDAETKANLERIYGQVLREISQNIQATLDEPDNFHDACARFDQLKSKFHSSMIPQFPKWRERFILKRYFDWNGSAGARIRANFLEAYDPLDWSSAGGRGEKIEPQDLKDAVIAWDAFDCTFGRDRLRRYRSENPDVAVIWLKDDNVQGAVNYYGVETVVDLRKYERLMLPRGSRGASRSRKDIRSFTPTRWIHENYDLDQPTIYVHSEFNDYRICGKLVGHDTARDWVEIAGFLGKLPEHTSVIVLMKDQRSLPEGRNWVHLDEILQDIVKEFDPVAYQKRAEVQSFYCNSLVNRLRDRKDQLPKRLQKLFDDVEYTANTLADTKRRALWLSLSGKQMPTIRTTLWERFRKLTARYPLLSMVERNDEFLDHYLKLIAR